MEGRKRFRDYKAKTERSVKIQKTYQSSHEEQNGQFVQLMKKTYAEEGHIRMRFWEAMAELEKVIDESDPDADLQIYHAYQTGEALKKFLQHNDTTKLRTKISVRKLFSDEEWLRLPKQYQEKFSHHYLHELYPQIKDWSWLPVIGFLHDCGKILATDKMGALQQWAVVGDTFPVGAPLAPTAVYYSHKFFAKNPDLNMKAKPKSKKFGKYVKHCGFEKVDMSWGHDEYLYSVLNRTEHHFPKLALYFVRFHSFYPWHKSLSYQELASDADFDALPALKMFQSCDLYSKDAKIPAVQELKAYYADMIEKWVPGRPEIPYNLRPAKILW